MHANQLTEGLGQEGEHVGGLHQWALQILLAAMMWVLVGRKWLTN